MLLVTVVSLQRKRTLIYTLKTRKRGEFMEDQHTDPHFEESHNHEGTSWFQENLRIIVSIFIVAAIALGIYSYSQRAENLSDEDIASLLETKGDEAKDSAAGDAMTQEGGEAGANSEQAASKGTVVTPELSEEKEGSYVETAEAGDGMTHLARRALTHALENNSDWNLSAEQKVYVEDYLQKHAGGNQGLNTGSKVEFSKEVMNQAIEQAKGLNEAQLAKIKPYAQKVSSYR